MTASALPSQIASLCLAVVLGLILVRCAAEWVLESLNQRHVRARADRVPDAFVGVVDEATYARSVAYTLVKSRFHQVESLGASVVLVLLLTTRILPWAHAQVTGAWGDTAWAMAAFLVGVMVILSLTSLPFDWHAQFRIEQRFGFNTMTPGTWWLDRLKGVLLAIALGYPLLVLVLKLVDWTGWFWWLWAWGAMLAFQFVMLLVAPVVIFPLFNKFTPLAPGSLRDRLLALAQRTGFQAGNIQVMDGSKRSRHSNAFFTGLGRLRKIVLYDTLIQQLEEVELEAVLAHEIGHYRKRHVQKMLAWSALTVLAGFAGIAWLAEQRWFLEAFGFAPGQLAPALLLFGLLSGVVTFWFSPLSNLWLRRFEYEADAFASGAVGTPAPLIAALRKLNEQNLSNLTPHPLYSTFHYSHPTLLEREAALKPGAGASASLGG